VAKNCLKIIRVAGRASVGNAVEPRRFSVAAAAAAAAAATAAVRWEKMSDYLANSLHLSPKLLISLIHMPFER
jgi:hypothetical protein